MKIHILTRTILVAVPPSFRASMLARLSCYRLAKEIPCKTFQSIERFLAVGSRHNLCSINRTLSPTFWQIKHAESVACLEVVFVVAFSPQAIPVCFV